MLVRRASRHRRHGRPSPRGSASTETRGRRAAVRLMSQRMSLARSRASMAPGSVPSSVSARLAAKQAELQALQQLRAESAQLTQELARLSERVDTLVCGGQSVASVMASWQGVFRAIHIAQAAMHPDDDTSRTVPEALVRIPMHHAT